MSADKTIDIYTSDAGNAGRAGNAKAVWRNSGDTNYRGKDPSSLISYWEPVRWINDAIAGITYKQPSAITLEDGTIVLAYRELIGGVDYIKTYKRSPSTGAWSTSVTVLSAATVTGTTVDPTYPCMVLLPDGRIMLYFWLETDGNVSNIRAYVSSDDAASWTLVSTGLIQTSIDVSNAGSFGSGTAGYDTRRLTAAYANGQILLVGELIKHDTDVTPANWYIQLASNSLGAEFSQIEIGSVNSVFVGMPQVIEQNGEFLLYSIGSDPSLIKQTRLASAYDSIANSYGSTVITGNAFADEQFAFGTLAGGGGSHYLSTGDLGVCVDPIGRIYIVVTYYANSGGSGSTKQVGIFRSDDNGTTFTAVGDKQSLSPTTSGNGIWWESGDASTYPDNYWITACQGRVLVACTHAASPGNEDNSISAFYLGGWSTITFPQRSVHPSQFDQGTWTRTWVPFDLPGDVGWTAAGTAATEDITSSGDLSVITASGNSRTYTVSGFTSSASQGIICRMRVEVDSGSVSSDSVGATFRLAEGGGSPAHREVTLRFSASQLRAIDVKGSSTIATVSVDFATSPVDVLVGFASSKLQVWYRTSGVSSDRSWTNAVSTTSLTNNTSGSTTTNAIVWGNIGAPGTSKWSEFHYAIGADTGEQLAGGFSNPSNLIGETYATVGNSTYIDSGLMITAVDGPALTSQAYTVSTRYGFPIERIFPSASPSPRSTWRSTTTGAQKIAFKFNSTVGTTAESDLGNNAICLGLFGINFKSFELQGYDVDTTAWTAIGSVDTAAGLDSLNFTRNGSTIVPSGSDNVYLNLNELEGATFSPNGSIFRKIKTNTAGLWNSGSAAKKSTIVLDTLENSDPTSGSAGFVIPRNVAVVFNTNGAKYSGYRISIGAQSTADGYFEIGNMVLGPVEFFGTQYSWARQISTTPNVSLDRRMDGSVYSRKLGPAYRNVSFSWTDGVDTSPLYASSISPDYIKASSSGGPVASVADVPHQMDGLATMIGSNSPVIYLPSIPVGSSASLLFNRRHEMMLGRITSPVQIENVVGDELADPGEVFRVATTTIEETV
jgi:hypothetical protein